MEQAVLYMAGIGFSVLGLSYLLRADTWDAWLQAAAARGQQASLVFGSVNLLLGSFILAFHPVWTGLPTVLTVIGLLTLLKGSIYLLFPGWLPIKLAKIRMREKPLLRGSGVALLTLGVFFLSLWCIEKNFFSVKTFWNGNALPEIQKQERL